MRPTHECSGGWDVFKSSELGIIYVFMGSARAAKTMSRANSVTQPQSRSLAAASQSDVHA